MAKCKYCCEESEPVIAARKNIGEISLVETLYVAADRFIGSVFIDGSGDILLLGKKIKYCPMCGRKL